MRDVRFPAMHQDMEAPFAFPSDAEEVVQIKRWCAKCERIGKRVNWKKSHDETLVSPSGIAHFQSWEGDESTACGVYAAAENWWWPS